MNWGNKLMVVFIIFAALIITLVYKAANTRFDLVSKDYYKDELRFQDKIDGIHKANSVSRVTLIQDAHTLTISMPKEMQGEKISGEAWFYCRSDAAKDKKFLLNLDDSNRLLIRKQALVKGPYQLKLNWKSISGNYYTEQEVFIQ